MTAIAIVINAIRIANRTTGSGRICSDGRRCEICTSRVAREARRVALAAGVRCR